MNCPECSKPMINRGNTDGIVYDSLPPFWYETYVCKECRLTKDVQIEDNGERMSSGGLNATTFRLATKIEKRTELKY